jgi:prevent-host-death family protein
MPEVSVREARNNLSQLIRRAQDGEDVVIANRGTPVARIVAVRAAPDGPALAAWLRAHQIAPEHARSKAEVDAYLAAERDSWE